MSYKRALLSGSTNDSSMAWSPASFNFDQKYVATDSQEAGDCLAQFYREKGLSEALVRQTVQHPPKPHDVTDLNWAQPESNAAKRRAALQRLEADYIRLVSHPKHLQPSLTTSCARDRQTATLANSYSVAAAWHARKR